MSQDERVSRREFVRDTTVAAAGAVVGLNAVAGAAPAKPECPSRNAAMEYRPLGKTGLEVSAVCLGGHWKKVPARPGTPEFAKNRRDVVSACIECGINYIDACCGGEVMAYAEESFGPRVAKKLRPHTERYL